MSYMDYPLLIDGYQCYPGAKGKNCQNATQKPMPQDIVSDLTDIYLQQTREQINVSPAPARPLVRPKCSSCGSVCKKSVSKRLNFGEILGQIVHTPSTVMRPNPQPNMHRNVVFTKDRTSDEHPKITWLCVPKCLICLKVTVKTHLCTAGERQGW